MNVTFMTGSQFKADYLASMLDVPLAHKKVDLDELQSVSLDTIVEHKVRQAYDIIGSPVLVEDVGLNFTALNGLPGPFVKFFVEQPNGLENMCRMLDGFNDRRARAECVFGYYDGERLELFHGGLDGMIADRPIGQGGFGWDAIFCPDGYGGRTRAELTPEEDAKTYPTIKPIHQVSTFLKSLDHKQ